jgi:hypothetical protein
MEVIMIGGDKPMMNDRGYGKLSQDQQQKIQESKETIVNAKEKIDLSITNVAGVKAASAVYETKIDHVGRDILKTGENPEGLKLTDAQKKILSNVEKGNIKELNKEKESIKAEVKALGKDAAKAEVDLRADSTKLEKSSEKVATYVEKPGFLRNNPLLGDSKGSRVRSAEEKMGAAVDKEYVAGQKTGALNEKAKSVETKISDLTVSQKELKENLDVRLKTAHEIHTLIGGANKEYEQLVNKYEARKETFFEYKNSSKMSKDDKAEIKLRLLELKSQIGKLEALEKNVGKTKIGDNEKEFIKSAADELKEIASEIKASSQGVKDSINSSTSLPMSFKDRIGHAAKNFFEAREKRVTEGALSYSSEELSILEFVNSEINNPGADQATSRAVSESEEAKVDDSLTQTTRAPQSRANITQSADLLARRRFQANKEAEWANNPASEREEIGSVPLQASSVNAESLASRVRQSRADVKPSAELLKRREIEASKAFTESEIVEEVEVKELKSDEPKVKEKVDEPKVKELKREVELTPDEMLRRNLEQRRKDILNEGEDDW